jgi:hypothetical protein
MNNLIPMYKMSCLIDASGNVQAAGIGVIELMEKIESLASNHERR